jgi:hypothetical protein
LGKIRDALSLDSAVPEAGDWVASEDADKELGQTPSSNDDYSNLKDCTHSLDGHDSIELK